MTDTLNWLWDLIQWCGHAVYQFWGLIFGFLGDPTGMALGNTIIWVMVFLAGWYGTSLWIAGGMIKELKGEAQAIEHCGVNARLRNWEQCYNKHGSECWTTTYRYEDVTPEIKVKKVKEAMGLAVLWPLVPFVVVVLLPIVVFLAPVALIGIAAYFMVALLIWKATKAVSVGIVNTTVMVSEHTVDSIAKRAESLNSQKALPASKKR